MESALAALTAASEGQGNLLAAAVEAAKCRATVEEITAAMEKVSEVTARLKKMFLKFRMQAKPSITPFNLRKSNLDEMEYFSFFYL